MCGICAVISVQIDGNVSSDLEGTAYSSGFGEESFHRLQNRGPDSFLSVSINPCPQLELELCGSLLHFRGDFQVAQPYRDEFGNFLLWNGEIFGGNLYSSENGSDTVAISEALSQDSSERHILSVLESIQGPWSFIYYQISEGRLWFGRDIFGRRSLLWSCCSSSKELSFCLSSVSIGSREWTEVGCEGIFCVDCVSSVQESHINITKYLWTATASGMPMKNLCFYEEDNAFIKASLGGYKLIPPVKELLNRDLSSVEMQVEEEISRQGLGVDIFQELLSSGQYELTVWEFEDVLSHAISTRVEDMPPLCKNCWSVQEPCCHSSVCVLFSGGLDSMVIAAMADRYVDKEVSIDLINVAFATGKPGLPDGDDFITPDRNTAQQGLKELTNLNADRKWNLVEVNITQEELKQEREKVIGHLISPSSTVLDDSIGCALWFAARGRGMLSVDGKSIPYQCPARVALLGMGADELLGGYSRHRGKFKTSGWNGLIDEMSLEIDRIGSRNLGRDDRIIADHGIEARFPFLDEDVVSFLNKLPINLKVDLNYPRGVGEKLLLRLLAYKLGLRGSSILPKRAIQFGSRIARCEDRKERGSDICERIANLAPT